MAPPTSGTSIAFDPTRPPSGSPPPLPIPVDSSGRPTSARPTESVRLRVAHWMERTFGRAYLPIAMAGGAVAGGTLGALTLGPIGGIAGAAAGAMLGGVLVFAG